MNVACRGSLHPIDDFAALESDDDVGSQSRTMAGPLASPSSKVFGASTETRTEHQQAVGGAQWPLLIEGWRGGFARVVCVVHVRPYSNDVL